MPLSRWKQTPSRLDHAILQRMAQDAAARRIGKHWTWVRLSEALAAQQLKEFFGMPPAHICIVLTFNRAVAKIAPTIDDLLGGTAADSQLQSAARDEIRSPSVLRHVMRILIPHVNHCGANFNLSRFSSNRCE